MRKTIMPALAVPLNSIIKAAIRYAIFLYIVTIVSALSGLLQVDLSVTS